MIEYIVNLINGFINYLEAGKPLKKIIESINGLWSSNLVKFLSLIDFNYFDYDVLLNSQRISDSNISLSNIFKNKQEEMVNIKYFC